MRIYISGPLKVVSDRKKAHRFYEFLASVVNECHHEAYLPHQNSDPITHRNMPHSQVYKMDFTNLTNSDIIIAVIDEPSTGVGAEIGIALERGIKVIAIYNQYSSPSRFVLGLLEDNPYAITIPYVDETHLKKLLVSALTSLKLGPNPV